MIKKVGWLWLGLCAVLTARQVPIWSSDLALWSQATTVSPLKPRPAVNVAAQYIQAGEWDKARWWVYRAERLIRDDRRAHERDVVRKILDEQDRWIDAFSPSR